VVALVVGRQADQEAGRRGHRLILAVKGPACSGICDPRVTLRNGEIADLFDLLGDLYELDGAVVYRVLAYRRAAKRFRETAESVWSLSEEGRLTELDDIGDTIATKVGELRATGTMAALEKLRGRVPESLVEIVRLPGLGAKTARRLWLELGITTLAELETAAREGRLHGQAGFG